MQTLDKLVIDAPAKHTATVIFVHGLGDTGEGWKDLAQLYKAELPHIKWVLPHAPIQPVTGNGGMPMPSWFDIFNFDFDPNRPGKEDYEGMVKTVNSLSQLISSEVDSGVPAERVVLGGFSQGGAMTLLTGLTIERKLAGLAVLSGWAPVPEKLKISVNRHAKSLPIFWGHGVNDPLVRYEFAVRSLEFLKEELKITAATEDSSKPLAERLKGVELHSYPGLTHSASNAELEDLKKWLKAVIPPIS